jgi:hypothetical protein
MRHRYSIQERVSVPDMYRVLVHVHQTQKNAFFFFGFFIEKEYTYNEGTTKIEDIGGYE